MQFTNIATCTVFGKLKFRMNLVEILAKGGPVIYLLIFTSVTVCAIGIERLNFYSRAGSVNENFFTNLKSIASKGDIAYGLELCRNEKNLFGAVALAGIDAAARSENVETAVTVAFDEAAMKFRARLNYLSMIVTMAPLLGLLGTIFGMIDSFNIFSIQAGQPLAITGGIGEALIATATGLCVAIFALIVHTYLAQKLDEKLTALDKISAIVTGGFSKNEKA